jgi:hypothetical protein
LPVNTRACHGHPGQAIQQRRIAHTGSPCTTSALLAEAIASQPGRPVIYRPVEQDGAARPAAAIANLLRTGS